MIRTWIALVATMLGAFMAVLDIQITNASLNDILGSLGATIEEGSWVSTSYLAAEIVVIPMSGWLSDVFSPRRYLLVNAGLFLLFSCACARSWNLNSMIVFRALQGLTGGVLIPMAFNLVLKLLPREDQGLGFALFGMTATFAPAVGPTVGGWLTEVYGWPSIFYLNLLPGFLLIAGVAWGLPSRPAKTSLLRNGDWWGMTTMATGLASLIIFLEEGNRRDWFNSRLITSTAMIAALLLTACLLIETNQKEPFIALRLLADRNFGLGTLVSCAFGAGMYGITFLLPSYLANVQGYNSLQIGQTIMWSGLPQLLMMPIAALLLRRIDARVLVTAGLLLFGASSLFNSQLTHLTAYDQLKLTQIIRAMGMPLVIVPLTALATGHLPTHLSGSASALFNMFRNLGGSIGIAVLATQLDVRERLHTLRLSETVTPFRPVVFECLETLTRSLMSRGLDSLAAGRNALKLVAGTIHREAAAMAYGDCFYLLGVVLVGMVLFVWLCKQARGASLGIH